MKKYLLLSVSLAGAVLSGCASQQPPLFNPFQADDLNAGLRSGLYKQKTNHFLVINDSSSSTGDIYTNAGFAPGSEPTKFNVEKELLSRMNKTIPDMPLTSGLRSFGFGSCVDYGSTKLNQATTAYSKSAFDAAINTLTCNSGGSPMASALDAAQEDLANASGNMALIILSDAHKLDSPPLPALKALKAKYGSRLCVYPVWIGNPEEIQGRLILNQLSDAGACGFSTAAADIASTAGMSNFVQRVFLGNSAPSVPECADADQDGVNDCEDKCPNTPLGATVNRQGCWVLKGVYFDFDKSSIKTKSSAKTQANYQVLDNAVDVIKKNPGLNIEIQGHTDSDGTDKYNLGLSNRRAQAVKTYLSGKVSGTAKLSTQGYGESRPVCPANDTDECKAENRRVQLDILQ